MIEIEKRHKALTVNPLKVSQPVGGVLAFLGMQGSMPLMHGSQGCTAFAKVLFVRHYREPIPVQTTAMDQISTVMGADENLVEALATISEKSKPQVIGVLSTGLSEVQGSDIMRLVGDFRKRYPQYADVSVVPVNTPDFVGGLESGFAAAVTAMINRLVPEQVVANAAASLRVNLLVGPSLTPGDLETLKETVELFGLEPIVLPDLSDSLDGHLTPDRFQPLTVGGTPRDAVTRMGDARATLVIGPALGRAADLLAERTGVPDFRFDSLIGLDAMDAFVHRLALLSGRSVPARLVRQRAQLQDAMVDTHFMLGQTRVGVALDPDHLLALVPALQQMGMEVVSAISPERGPALGKLPLEKVKIGDLDDLESEAKAHGAELLIGNSHCGQGAERLGIPLLRMGFPQYDLLGGYQRTTIGYRGTRQLYFDLANLVLGEHHKHAIAPYRSKLHSRDEYSSGGENHAPGSTATHSAATH